jgi:hypothetical protein
MRGLERRPFGAHELGEFAPGGRFRDGGDVIAHRLPGRMNGERLRSCEEEIACGSKNREDEEAERHAG